MPESKIIIYKAFPAYQNYLSKFYEEGNRLEEKSFSEQKQALIYDGFPWIFTWSTNISEQKATIFETVHNCEPLQRAWNRDKSFGEDWQVQIVLEQIKEIKPQVCVLYPPELFNTSVINEIKSMLKNDVVIISYDGMNRMNESLYSSYDVILTCSDYISRYYQNKNVQTYTLNFCFDENILAKIDSKSDHKYAVGFSGSIYTSIHDDRYDLLKYLTRRTKLEIRSEFGQNLDYSLFSKIQLRRLIKKKDYDNYLGLWKIDKSNRGPVYGLGMYQFLRDSGISINMHGDKIKFAANVRLFEVTGVGSCLLTDWKENMSELFEPDKEVVLYRSIEEAYDKIKFLKKNERVRSKIAKQGQHRTLSNYTYKESIPKLVKYLTQLYN